VSVAVPFRAEVEATPRRYPVRAVLAGLVGNILEWYDFAIYAFLVPVFSKLFFSEKNQAIAVLLTLAVFGAGFVARPLGAFLFGHLGDKYGRRFSLSVVMVAMGLSTFCMGLLPTYESVGVFAPILLVALRLLQGLSSGGEWGGSASFVVEYAPANRRGFFGSLHMTGVVAGFLLGSVVVALINAASTPDMMLAWVWRVPLLLGLAVAIVGLLVRVGMEETPTFAVAAAKGEVVEAPIKKAFTENRNAVVNVVGITVFHAISSWVFLVYIVTYLSSVAKLPFGSALNINFWGLVVAAIVSPLTGILSDRIGRRPLMITSCLLTIICIIPVFKAFNSGDYDYALCAHCGMVAILCLYFGPMPAALVEMFPTNVRYSGLSISYNLAHAILGGFGPFIAQYLAVATGNPISSAYYVIVGAAVSLFVLLRVKETAFLQLK
jgi:MFS transporter, MHS family, proline/betaine transporter